MRTAWVAAGGMLLVSIVILGVTLARPRPAPPPPPPEAPAGPVRRDGDLESIRRGPHLLAARMTGIEHGAAVEVISLADPAAPRAVAPLECERIAFSRGHGICLRTSSRLMGPRYEAVFFDERFQPVARIDLDGTPTRTRVSPDGRYGAITVFVTGQEHGYNSVSFSTKTTLVEMASGKVLADLEKFTTTREGQPFAAKDFNFWGVTFASDSNVFYASLKTAGQTYLVRGDAARRSFTVLRENVECPALSPDGRLLAYKKRVGGDLSPWRFHVLELATMLERPLAAETRSIDDQLEWLDEGRVLYSTMRTSQSPVGDVWVASVAGSEPARPFALELKSPVVVR